MQGQNLAMPTPDMQPKCPDLFRGSAASSASDPPAIAMVSGPRRVTVAALLGALFIVLPGVGSILIDAAMAADTDQSKTAGGLTVYLGVVPAEIVKGPAASANTERPMHGRIPRGPHEYHVVVPSSTRRLARGFRTLL
jgi:hypothetical protein